jgi:hypothetical protein
MAKLAPPEDHELAGRFLESKGLCLDLAREHTSAIAKNEERRQVRHHYEALQNRSIAFARSGGRCSSK